MNKELIDIFNLHEINIYFSSRNYLSGGRVKWALDNRITEYKSINIHRDISTVLVNIINKDFPLWGICKPSRIDILIPNYYMYFVFGADITSILSYGIDINAL